RFLAYALNSRNCSAPRPSIRHTKPEPEPKRLVTFPNTPARLSACGGAEGSIFSVYKLSRKLPMSANSDHLQERISDVDVSSEMKNSFLEYAYSVIYSRALPDARDGLKPVQRRILYQMDQMGLHPDRGHVKSARVVGEAMGKLHPHGARAIHDALVRLAQDFPLRVPLVDGHGNFGSLDDGPAAPRYTEARLQAAALALVESLDEDVV